MVGKVWTINNLTDGNCDKTLQRLKGSLYKDELSVLIQTVIQISCESGHLSHGKYA